jgi:TrmH family RNA methyltransferase
VSEPTPLASRNQHVQELRRLSRDRSARRSAGLVVVEGRVLAHDLLAQATAAGGGASIDVVAVYADPTDSEAVAVAHRAEECGATWYPVTADVLDGAADAVTSQGVALLVRQPGWSLADLGATGLVLALDAVADPGNAGTLLRTAAAVGAHGVIAANGADLFAPKVVRAARGAQLTLPTVELESLGPALLGLVAKGRSVVVAEAAGEQTLWDTAIPADAVIVVGSEAHGVSPAALDAADLVVSVPMPGGTESLNAAVTGSLLAYEWLRRNRP